MASKKIDRESRVLLDLVLVVSDQKGRLIINDGPLTDAESVIESHRLGLGLGFGARSRVRRPSQLSHS